MNSSARLRKLNDLDKLEKRVKEQANPSPQILQSIAAERANLLTGNPQGDILDAPTSKKRR